MQCYGQLGRVSSDTKFACYSCLLDNEEVRFSQMKVTCLKRRALYYLRERPGGLQSIEEIAHYLGRERLSLVKYSEESDAKLLQSATTKWS